MQRSETEKEKQRQTDIENKSQVSFDLGHSLLIALLDIEFNEKINNDKILLSFITRASMSVSSQVHQLLVEQ